MIFAAPALTAFPVDLAVFAIHVHAVLEHDTTVDFAAVMLPVGADFTAAMVPAVGEIAI